MTAHTKTFISDLVPGQALSSPFLILDLTRAQSSRGSTYLSLNLADCRGQVGAKVWDRADELAAGLKNGRVAWIRGLVESYRGQTQVVIKEAEAVPEPEVHWPDFLAAAPHPPEAMRAELDALVAELADPDYRWLVEAALAHPRVAPAFDTAPAAKAFHHAYRSGLLEHSLSVARLATLVSGQYPQLNRDLLLAGAILHDIGKLWEFTPGPEIDLTTPGRLLGHLVMGQSFLAEIIAQRPDFPPAKALLIQHLIISHHGDYQFGSAKRPKILEALALHQLDDLDAKINGLGGFIERHAHPETGWTDYNRLLEQYFFDPAVLDQGPPEVLPAPVQSGARRPKKATLKDEAPDPSEPGPADAQDRLF